MYVDGDSLIGQTKLKVTFLKWENGGPNINWTKAITVENIHMTAPVLVSTLGSLKILMTNWMDEESTVAHYLVEDGEFSFVNYYGVFVQGAQIQAAFSREGRLFSLIREKTKEQWAYSLCEH